MPRNGSGQYNPLTNTWNPPVTGVLATGADFQAQLNDISAAITQSVSKDGQTPMTANLPMGNNSIVGIASGTQTSPSISANGDTNTGLYFPAADTVAIATGGVKRVELNASGNLLVGTTTDAGRLTVSGKIRTLGGDIEVDSGQITTNSSTNPLRLGVDGSERARITSGGDFVVARGTGGDTTVGVTAYSNGTITCARSSSINADLNLYVYSTGAAAARFYVGMGGTIYATSTTITAISDQRLKENIRDLDAGLTEVMALKPRKYDWKSGKGKNKKNDRGWIAQEFEQVFPDMVDTWADPAPEGEEPYKAVNADLIPVLVKAIQEQQALIDAQKTAIESLTARIAALEAK